MAITLLETIRKNFEFREKLKYGEDGEREVANLLIKMGYSILPLYQFNNENAPLLFTLNKDLILPDLTVFNAGKVIFVEVKTKNRWTKWKGNTETGFNYRLYQHYIDVMGQTKLNVVAIFNHKTEPPTGCFCIDLSENYSRVWDGLNEKTKQRVEQPIVLFELKRMKGFFEFFNDTKLL